MSGIAGIIRFDGGPVDLREVEAMTTAMAHRGPDGIRHWSSGSVALGHCMLVTTSEALEETQPLTNETGDLVLVMDGRVDNWEELRATLLAKGAQLRTRADAELVLRAYETWGEECLQWVDGDYALVIWDARRRRAFCARDRIGAKPFVYHWDGKRLIFGSEIRAVLDATGEPRRWNEGFLAETLAASWVSRDETLWQGVMRLVAARYMVVGEGSCRIETYWHPENIPLLRYKHDSEYVDHYREVLFDTVRRLSRSHRVVGCDVSGGLDSSAVFAVADALWREGLLPAPDIQGYTLKFEEGTDAYELDYAHEVGAHVGRQIKEVEPTLKPLEWYLDEAVRRATIPNFPNGIMQLSEYEALKEAGGRIHLDGVGGDQWLAFADNDLAEAFQTGQWREAGQSIMTDVRQFGVAHAAYRAMRHGVYPVLPRRVRSAANNLRYALRRLPRLETEWLEQSLRQRLEERQQYYAQCLTPRMAIGLRERVLTLRSAYNALARERLDVMASQAGIERRSPLQSEKFIEMALSLPLTQLRRGKTDRAIHRTAMHDWLPAVVHSRRTKAEFSNVFACVSEELDSALSHPEPLAPGWTEAEKRDLLRADLRFPNRNGDHWAFGMLLCLLCCRSMLEDATLEKAVS
ncbi:asparagine synthetase B [Silicimonas algicola]|uniref:asparagine synthase (glutamine-hydrolyzing) n=1 Tax=Silicimonas algicola TaxID=1826607 RepID=A0A316GI50_9RHOB|nr:asparagine synthase-related protein [Silicimonas algicola]AZQ66696.1 asparagine synthetase B [Silicimonas algicola]PWK59050.1 asparagine synthase (glutamine-hydrolysing) [Silicimonas algicola]